MKETDMSAATSTSSLIVTTSVSGRTRTQLWNPELPLTLGHPLRWIAERTEQGVRIRHLALDPGKPTSGSLCLVSPLQIEQGTEVRLPGRGQVSLSIRPAHTMRPAFGGLQGDRLTVYACNGAWITASQLFDKSYQGIARVGEVARTRIFDLSEQGPQFNVSARVDGVSLRLATGSVRALTKAQAMSLTREELAGAVIEYGSRAWRFGLSHTVALPDLKHVERDSETLWFRKALGGAAVAFTALLVVAWLCGPRPSPTPRS